MRNSENSQGFSQKRLSMPFKKEISNDQDLSENDMFPKYIARLIALEKEQVPTHRSGSFVKDLL